MIHHIRHIEKVLKDRQPDAKQAAMAKYFRELGENNPGIKAEIEKLKRERDEVEQ